MGRRAEGNNGFGHGGRWQTEVAEFVVLREGSRRMTDAHGTPDAPQDPQRETDRPQGPTDVPPIVDRFGPLGREANPKARMWAMLCHLAGFAGVLPVVPAIGCLLGPLIVWLIKKNEFPFVDEQGKEVVNFQITMLIYLAVGALLVPFCGIGVLVMIAVGVVDAIFLIIAAIKANDGYHYRYPYPLIIRFIK
jgi:uncharacterized Tic20 family protein